METMQGVVEEQIAPEVSEKHVRPLVLKAAGTVVAGLLFSFLLPIVPILAGAVILIIVAIHLAVPDLRDMVEPILRIPVADARVRHTRLGLFIGSGLALVLIGSTAATLRGNWRGASQQRDQHRAAADASVLMLIDRAHDRLDADLVPAAELALLDALAVSDLDPERREEIEDLLERIQRSDDEEYVTGVLKTLDADELAALRVGSAIPDELDFGEDVLTYRAVKLATGILERNTARR